MSRLSYLIFFPYFLYSALILALLILCSFPITALLILFPDTIKNRGMYLLMKLICHVWFLLTGMWPRNYNRDVLDTAGSYIIIPNHQSYLDAAIIYTSIPVLFKSLGKKEMEKTPIYGLIYKTVVITVDRSSLRARALSFRQMKEAMENGLSVTIFAEGTFPDHPQEELLPLQNGAFSLAILQQCPIAPVLFLDASRRMHPSRIIRCTPGKNRAVFLPPVQVTNLNREDTDALRELTQNYMQNCLNYCREHGPHHAKEFAVNWMQNNRNRYLAG